MTQVTTTTNQDEAINAIRKQFGPESQIEMSPRTRNVFLRYAKSGHTFTVAKSGYVVVLHPDGNHTLGYIAQIEQLVSLDEVKPKRTRARMSAKRNPEYMHVAPVRKRV
jgi:hypothetical protein